MQKEELYRILQIQLQEAKAILMASKHCKKSQHNQNIFQTESMIMCKVLEEKWKSPWIIANMVREIQKCLSDKQYNIQNILRKGNKLADHLANIDIDKGNGSYTEFNSLEMEGRMIINSEKLQYPQLRVSP